MDKAALPYAFNFVLGPGLLGRNNGSEGVVRAYIAPDRNRYTFVNEKAAYNHSIFKTFAVTCRKNDVSTYGAAINIAKDVRWSVFNSGIPPPAARGPKTTVNSPSDGPNVARAAGNA